MNITENNLLSILKTECLRNQLIGLLEKDQNELDLFNHVAAIAENIECDQVDFKLIFEFLENEGKIGKELIGALVINPLFPEEILFNLYEQDRYICSMAHRRGPINLLLKIAREKDGWPEAIITCCIYYYEQENISIKQFENLIEEFIDCYNLLYRLIYISAYNQNKKNNSILTIINKSNFAVELNDFYNELKTSIALENTTNVEYIKEMYLVKNHRFLKAISLNINCPIDILEKLQEIKEVKNAKEIRVNANNTLKKKKGR